MKKHGMPIPTAELVSVCGRTVDCWLFGFLRAGGRVGGDKEGGNQ